MRDEIILTQFEILRSPTITSVASESISWTSRRQMTRPEGWQKSIKSSQTNFLVKPTCCPRWPRGVSGSPPEAAPQEKFRTTAEREGESRNLFIFFVLEVCPSRGQNLVLTVLFVPNSLGSGLAAWGVRCQWCHFEPSKDASHLRPDVISPTKILPY